MIVGNGVVGLGDILWTTSIEMTSHGNLPVANDFHLTYPNIATIPIYYCAFGHLQNSVYIIIPYTWYCSSIKSNKFATCLVGVTMATILYYD